MKNHSSPSNLWRWFDPRHRQIGSWAFILNRVTAIGLTVYLAMHLVMLGNLARGPEAYDGFIALVKNPFFMFGELLVIAAGILHGLNGIRIALTSFGIGVSYQKQLFIGLTAIGIVGIIYFTIHMFSGA